MTFRQAFAPWAAGDGATGVRQRVTSKTFLGADRVDVAVVVWGAESRVRALGENVNLIQVQRDGLIQVHRGSAGLVVTV